MSTFSWTSGIGGDWNTAGLWDAGQIPNSGMAVAAIVQPGSYAVTIALGETETVGTLSLASASCRSAASCTSPPRRNPRSARAAALLWWTHRGSSTAMVPSHRAP